MKKIIILLVLFLLIFACKEDKTRTGFSTARIDSLKNEFQAYVGEKDNDFLTQEWSPLTPADKVIFEGLHYYPYNYELRFEGPIHTYAVPDSEQIMGTRKGDVRKALKYGYFEFKKDGIENRLEIYKILASKPGQSDHLFLGFWDETSDDETYGGGRYVDMKETGENLYLVDFNYAYSPYCAYSDRYSCAIPPLENRLTIPINAGEKIFKEH